MSLRRQAAAVTPTKRSSPVGVAPGPRPERARRAPGRPVQGAGAKRELSIRQSPVAAWAVISLLTGLPEGSPSRRRARERPGSRRASSPASRWALPTALSATALGRGSPEGEKSGWGKQSGGGKQSGLPLPRTTSTASAPPEAPLPTVRRPWARLTRLPISGRPIALGSRRLQGRRGRWGRRSAICSGTPWAVRHWARAAEPCTAKILPCHRSPGNPRRSSKPSMAPPQGRGWPAMKGWIACSTSGL